MKSEIPESKKRWDVRVKGSIKYQSNLGAICGGTTKNGHNFKCRARLVFEDSNTVDPNAVAVFIGDRQVGYLPKDYAPKYRAHFKLPEMECDAKIDGGYEERPDMGHFGVLLDLPSVFEDQ